MIPRFAVVVLLAAVAPVNAAPDAPAFGHQDSLPPPKSLIFSIGPDKIIADAETWKAMGIDGFFMDNVASEWSSDIWATDGKPYTIGASDETFQKVRQANDVCRRLGMENFLKIVYANPLEWFNDVAWQQIEHNFRQFALFARDSGCTGIALDIEYVGQQYAFDWDGYDYTQYSRAELIDAVRDRSTDLLRAMYDEFPEMIFLLLPEEGFSLGTHIQAAFIEEAAHRNAPGGVHFCMESTYTSADVRRVFANASLTNQLFHRVLSPGAVQYWESRCSLASGVWPTGFDILVNLKPEETPEAITRAWAGSLMASSRYNWVYLDRYAESHVGRNRDVYPGHLDFDRCADILRRKEVSLEPADIAIATALRALPDRDFALETGYEPVPRFMFPYVIPVLELTESGSLSRTEMERQWRTATDYYLGKDFDLAGMFRPVAEWQIVGPFASPDLLEGHNMVYGPEEGVDLNAEYEGVTGNVTWQLHRLPDKSLGIDLKSIYSPNEHVTAYAACWVDSPIEQRVQARFSTNDAGKLWIGDQLVDDFANESWSVLDRDIIPVTLSRGRTPILAKVTNGIGSWAMVLRFTDSDGNPIENLTFSATP